MRGGGRGKGKERRRKREREGEKAQWLRIKHLDPISDHPFFESNGFSYLVIWFYEQFKT